MKPGGFYRANTEFSEAVKEIRAGLRAVGDFVDVSDMVHLRVEASSTGRLGHLGVSSAGKDWEHGTEADNKRNGEGASEMGSVQ